MAKRQSTTETRNVVRLDGEGKTHAEGKHLTPLCNLKGNEKHSWVSTSEAVDCIRCVNLAEKQRDARERLEYNTRVSEANEPGSQHLHPMEDAQNETPAYFQEPKHGTPVPRAEFTSEGVKPLPAEVPVIAENGETVTVPVDYDNPSAGRRELDASKGERVISEDTYTVRVSPEMDMRRERARAEYVDAFAMEAPKTAEAVQALIRKLQSLHNGMTGATESEGFSVTYHEPKNGPALEDVEIPALPQGVNANTWEMAFTANTESARAYWTRKANAQRAEFLEMQEAMEESRKAVELDTPPF